MIKCGVCGSANEAEAVFCGTCGSRLAPVAPVEGADVAVPAPRSPAPPAALEAAPPTPVATEPLSATGKTVAESPDAPGFKCPVCGASNNVSRDFCWKCASALRPTAPPRPPSPFGLRFWLTFLLSSAVGIAVVVGGAWLLRPPAASAGTPVAVAGRDGDQLQFNLQPGTPKPLNALPAKSTIQLASYTQNAAASIPPILNGRAPWWNFAVPRVPPVTQFDGGPFEQVNCVMAAGAMLARLAYGIVTTGSQLRALQDDQSGATNYGDLETAVERGWGAHFFKGVVTPLQLRALLWGGAGAVIGVVYGDIPDTVRLQKSFTGNHSIYIDAFRPAGVDGPAAYYVEDPIGPTWRGYQGGWWPADDVEKAAEAHSQGKISATWAFAGGVVPKDHPVLPKDAYPSESPSATAEPTATPSASGQPSGDPMPTGDTTLPSDPPIGDPPPDVPQWVIPNFVTNLYLVDPAPGLPLCATVPAPVGCPKGIVGITDIGGVTIPVATSPPSLVNLLYANPIALGTYQIIFDAPPNTQPALWVWNSAGGGAVQQATVDQGFIGGSPVSIATITVDPAGNFSFVATATGSGISSSSVVGSLIVGQ